MPPPSTFCPPTPLGNPLRALEDGADIPEWQSIAQDRFNDAFALIFVVEATLALIGLGPRCYFSMGRQVFDFIVTVASVADVLLNMSNACSG